VINLGYVPDWTPTERADILNEFRKALRDFPEWSIERAFDQWVHSHPRRPSPAEIVMLADRALEPIRHEITYRKKESQRIANDQTAGTRTQVDREGAQAICDLAGFTVKNLDAVSRAPMTRNRDDLQRAADARVQQPHWSETVSADSPQMDALRKSRAENRLVTEARAQQAKGGAAQ